MFVGRVVVVVRLFTLESGGGDKARLHGTWLSQYPRSADGLSPAKLPSRTVCLLGCLRGIRFTGYVCDESMRFEVMLLK